MSDGEAEINEKQSECDNSITLEKQNVDQLMYDEDDPSIKKTKDLLDDASENFNKNDKNYSDIIVDFIG